MLRTIGDAGEYILALPQKRGRLAHWEQVRRLLMKETSVATVSHQVPALSEDDKLDVFAFESIFRSEVAVNRTQFTFRIDRWDLDGHTIMNHIAGSEDLMVAMAAYERLVDTGQAKL